MVSLHNLSLTHLTSIINRLTPPASNDEPYNSIGRRQFIALVTAAAASNLFPPPPTFATEQARPRFFDANTKLKCWEKAKRVPNRDPDRWRFDAVGNIVCKRLHACQGCLCYEYDHIVPFSRGGESVSDNCQILQTRVNRSKSDKTWVENKVLRGYSCKSEFSDEELDLIEMAVYGSVVRRGKKCVVGSVDGMIGRNRVDICDSSKK